MAAANRTHFDNLALDEFNVRPFREETGPSHTVVLVDVEKVFLRFSGHCIHPIDLSLPCRANLITNPLASRQCSAKLCCRSARLHDQFPPQHFPTAGECELARFM